MKSFTLNRVIFSAGALFLGIILLIWPTGSIYFLAKFIGVFLAVGGFAAGVMYFQDHDSAMKSILLVLALVMLICGAVIFLHPRNGGFLSSLPSSRLRAEFSLSTELSDSLP